jgi:dUTP pyrophosphatase
MSLQVKIINKSSNPLPQYETEGSSGLDIRAFIPSKILLQPLERKLIPTGLFLEIPQGYEGQIRPRSGLALKKGITIPNSPGTIDSDYRGEIKILLINLSTEVVEISPAERIAQLIVAPCERISWELSTLLTETERNTGGFGSTGS